MLPPRRVANPHQTQVPMPIAFSNMALKASIESDRCNTSDFAMEDFADSTKPLDMTSIPTVSYIRTGPTSKGQLNLDIKEQGHRT